MHKNTLKVTGDTDYIHQPGLAEDLHQAHYYQNTQIEICCDLVTFASEPIQHIVFDHDGTLSTLRQGWEPIMQGVMLDAILGDRDQPVAEAFFQEIHNQVQTYIDRSTGIQTIEQMETLEEMVRKLGLVPASEVRDAFEYKRIYHDALHRETNHRLYELLRGELKSADYTIKGAIAFLKILRAQDIVLYLASGSDEDDVVKEARALGYAELFNGGIYGALDHLKKPVKKLVIEKIIQQNKLTGPELACFGDGPVEMRECRKHNGVAIGVASDEIRRYGLNVEKRTRLIKAGAQLIIQDYSQPDQLIKLLFKS